MAEDHRVGEADTLVWVLGAGAATVRVKGWLTEPATLEAVNVKVYVPTAAAPGIPPRTPVAALKVSPRDASPPAGPLSVRVGAGAPKSATVNELDIPTGMWRCSHW